MRGTMGYCHNAAVRKDCFVNEHLNYAVPIVPNVTTFDGGRK
jgi:hypothetical protein